MKEICSLTNPEDWRHVPGSNNPADLPSRGCLPAQLLESRWWEGPQWLYERVADWPAEELVPDNAVICSERKGIRSRSRKMNSVDVDTLNLKPENNEHTAAGESCCSG